jgi:phosphotransferase system enzyme I (PtsI)
VGALFKGRGVSPGVALGSAFVLHADTLPVVPNPIPPERVHEEVDRFNGARESAREELREVKRRVQSELGESYAGILDAQLLILDDPNLVGGVVQRIRVGRVGARWALKEVVAEHFRRFDALDDSYLRERSGDLADVHRRLQRLLRGGPGGSDDKLPPGPHVVVAHSLVPSDAITLSRQDVVGLATDVGGPTSHTAILAQALSVPAVAGLRNLSQQVETGAPMILDGDTGEVRISPTEEQVSRAAERHRAWIAMEERVVAGASDLPAMTRDGVKVEVRANLEFASEIPTALRYGARGVGLYRSEFLFLSHAPRLPSEEEHYRTYVEIADSVAPHPAVFRTLDLGGEKYFHEVLARNESNPVLGLRAVRFCLRQQEIFRPQLRALLRAATRDNVRIMLPLVTTRDEILQVRKILAEEAEQLKSVGLEARADVPLGIMIEVPAAAVAADLLAGEVDFFSIGTNDLIQYLLAVDRGNESVSYLYQPLHPGVLRLIKYVVDAAQAWDIPVSLCGEMAADPRMIGHLVGLGLRELSVQPRAVPMVRQAVEELTASAAAQAAERAVGQAIGRPSAAVEPAEN